VGLLTEAIKNSPDKEKIQLLLDCLRSHAKEAAVECRTLQDALGGERLIDPALIEGAAKTLQCYAQTQSEFQEELKSVSPECDEKNFAVIERHLAEKNKHAEALISAVQALGEFCRIHSDDAQIMDELEPHRAKVQNLLDSADEDSIISEAEPYRVFLGCIKDAQFLRALPDEKSLLLSEEFGLSIYRFLCLREFYLGEKIAPNGTHDPDPVAPVIPKPKRAVLVAAPKDQYLFQTSKEQTQFNGTSFLNEMRRKTPRGWVLASPYTKLQIKFLVNLVLFSILTEEQLKRYILSKDMDNIIDFAVRDGYVTKITGIEDGTVSYCLSPKGLQIFNTHSCKEFINLQRFKIPGNKISSSALVNHQEFIAPMIYSNNVVLFLQRLMKRWQASFTEERISFNVNFDGGKNEYTAVMTWDGPSSIKYQYLIDYADKDFVAGSDSIGKLAAAHLTRPDPLQKYIYVYDNSSIAQVRSGELEGEFYCAASNQKTGRVSFFFKGDGIDEMQISLNSFNENAQAETVMPELRADEPSAEEQAPVALPAVFQGTARQIAADLLKYERTPADFDNFSNLVLALLSEGTNIQDDDVVENSMAQVLLLLKTLSCQSANRSRYEAYYQSLVLAVDSPIEKHEYRSDALFDVFADAGQDTVFYLSAMLRALFAPAMAYDYLLINHAKGLFAHYENSFGNYPELKPLYNLFLQIVEFSPEGFSDSLLQQFSDQSERDIFLAQIKNEALSLYEVPVIRIMIQGLPQMLNYCFGKDSDFRQCLEFVVANDRRQFVLVQDVYERFCTKTESGQWRIADDKVNEWFETNWRKSREEKKMLLNYSPKEVILEGCRKRLNLLKKWLDFSRPDNTQTVSIEDFNALKNKILSEIKTVSPVIEKNYDPAGKTVLTALFGAITQRLQGQTSRRRWLFADILRTGFFGLDEEGLPVIIGKNDPVRYYEPWRLALKHTAAPVIGLKEALARITDASFSDYFDNIGTAVNICEYLKEFCGEEYESAKYLNDVPPARKTSDQKTEEFKSGLETAFAYGRIGENDKESLLSQIEQYCDKFYALNNFGMWQGFLQALEHNIEDISKKRFQELEQDIKRRRNNGLHQVLAEILDKAWEKLQPPESNFVVAEEYINNFDSSKADNRVEPENYGKGEPDYFLKFLSDEVFGEIYALCRKNRDFSLRRFGMNYVEDYLKKQKYSAQYQDSARSLINNLPNRPTDVTALLTRNLLQGLGFNVESVEPAKKTANPYSHMKVNVKPDQKDKAEYAHPVDIMGTKLPPQLDVIFLFGQKQPNEIVDNICGLELGHTSIVFLNGALGLPARRQIAERFHQEKTGQNPFLLIDWVLLLHLATKQITERLPALLNCTLPYTSSFQPFVNAGAVSDEMFIGRKQELGRILDFNGPVIVYGGRQLGKTALLERALSRAHHPEKKEYAVLISPSYCESEDELMKVLNGALINVKLLTHPSNSLRECASELQKLYNAQKWSRLLLMIDEADKLLENFKNSRPAYSNLTPLADLRRTTGNNFKFVLAGLHNVCRAAAEPNTIFGQLGGPLCIKPLSAPDAWSLLTRPLSYLGFKCDNAHLEHILVNTIFYPGIIHHVGYQLVENLSIKYADYYSAAKENPPYELTDKQLGSIMSSESLNSSINDRIKWTLEVDPRYFMLARVVAFLNYIEPGKNNHGYPVANILEYAGLLEISCLKDIDAANCKDLLLEMVEMGILVEPSTNAFRLRQRRFLEAVGKNTEEIEQAINAFEGRPKS
jgi:hypothetical protein